MTWQIDDDLYVTRKTGLGIEQPQERLEVNGKIKTTDLQASGIVQALSFQGDGSNLTGVVKKAGDTITGALTVQNNLTVTGNVGIATTVAPTERLEVNGNVKANFFLGDGSSLTGVVKNLDSVVKKVGDIMAGPLTIQNNLTVTGNVGIATTVAPSERLEVNGNVKATSFLGDGSNLTGVVKNLDLAVKKAGDLMTGALTIQNNLTVTGNVSLGSLTVNERMSVTQGVIQRGGDPITTTADLGLYSQLDGQWMRFVTKNAPFRFFSDGGAGTKHIFIIEPSGTVKINQGTQSSFGGHLCLSKIDGSPGRGQWHINIAPNNALNFVETGIADYRLTIAPGGNVGIGTNPMATLHIKQTANNSGIRLDEFGSSRYFNIAYEGQGNIHFYHQNTIGQWMGTDGTWKHNSDISLKKDISSMNNILDKVIQLNPVHFTWKDSNLSNIGFIAQEVQQIFPELVSSVNRNGDNLKGLSYDSFGVIAIAAIKEMKSKYDQEIKILQEQIKILQEQIAKILTEKSKL